MRGPFPRSMCPAQARRGTSGSPQASIFESRRRHQTARSKATGPSYDDLVGTASKPDVSADDASERTGNNVHNGATPVSFDVTLNQHHQAANSGWRINCEPHFPQNYRAPHKP